MNDCVIFSELVIQLSQYNNFLSWWTTSSPRYIHYYWTPCSILNVWVWQSSAQACLSYLVNYFPLISNCSQTCTTVPGISYNPTFSGDRERNTEVCQMIVHLFPATHDMMFQVSNITGELFTIYTPAFPPPPSHTSPATPASNPRLAFSYLQEFSL